MRKKPGERDTNPPPTLQDRCMSMIDGMEMGLQGWKDVSWKDVSISVSIIVIICVLLVALNRW